MELIPKEALSRKTGGSYLIPRSKLEDMKAYELEDFAAIAEVLARENPDFYFMTTEDFVTRGVRVSWWVRDEHGTEESGDPKVLPWK